jgi:hypothetical protein
MGNTVNKGFSSLPAGDYIPKPTGRFEDFVIIPVHA